MKPGARDVVLTLDALEGFLPLVTACVERAAVGFGLGKQEALGLTVASEEIFAYLCRAVMQSGGPLEIRCVGLGYCVQVDFRFSSENLDLGAFNLTTTISPEDDAAEEIMGLVIASRLVDRFRLTQDSGRLVCLSLVQEKAYPALDGASPPVCPTLTAFSVRAPSPDEVKLIARQATSCYDGRYLSDCFLYPGKLIDRIDSEHYRALAAIGPAGEIGGAVFWQWIGPRIVECMGPYVFDEVNGLNIADALIEGCIGAIARTQAVGLLNTRPTPHLPEHHFERLGIYTLAAGDGTPTPIQAWFRLMHEDAGCALWVHAELEGFVADQCRRLVLPREIRAVQRVGERLPAHSVLAAESDRLQQRVVLRPMWPGADCDDNIARHVQLLRQESIPNVFFLMDLGQPWQADFTPGLLRHGFKPCFLLPCAGEADLVLFQLAEALP